MQVVDLFLAKIRKGLTPEQTPIALDLGNNSILLIESDGISWSYQEVRLEKITDDLRKEAIKVAKDRQRGNEFVNKLLNGELR